MIKVCNLVRLLEKDAKGLFIKDGQKSVLREGAKVLAESVIESENNYKDTGVLWIVDEKATEERNKLKAPKEEAPKEPKSKKAPKEEAN